MYMTKLVPFSVRTIWGGRKLIGLITGTQLAVNWYTLGTAAVLGSPGVALMLAVQTVFNT